MTDTDLRPDATTELREVLTERVLIMDGAMGTMIQQQGLSEAEFRGERFADWGSDLQGNNDLLVLTQPELIVDLHHQYLAAGADLVETNTFNAQRISLADYGMADLAHEINLEAARLAAAVQQACVDEELLTLTCGPTGSVVRLIPALVVTSEEVDAGVERFTQAVHRVRDGAA